MLRISISNKGDVLREIGEKIILLFQNDLVISFIVLAFFFSWRGQQGINPRQQLESM